MGLFMRNFIVSYFKDESGAAAAEYALILTIIGGAIALGVTALSTGISTALQKAGTAVSGYTY